MKCSPFISGNNIYLRLLEKKDINNNYLNWLNDQEINQYLDVGYFPTSRKSLEEYYESISKSRSEVMFAIVLKKTDCHIGNIKLGSINWVHQTCDLGIIIGDKKSHGKGIGKEACSLVLNYAFNKLNLRKVTLGVISGQVAGIRCYKSVGFTVEGIQRNMYKIKGKMMDKVLMGVERE